MVERVDRTKTDMLDVPGILAMHRIDKLSDPDDLHSRLSRIRDLDVL